MKQQLDTSCAFLRQACHLGCPGCCIDSVIKGSWENVNVTGKHKYPFSHTHFARWEESLLLWVVPSTKSSSEHRKRRLCLQITAKYSTLIIWLDHAWSTKVFKTPMYSSCGIYCLCPYKSVIQSRTILDSTGHRSVLQHDPQHVFGLSKPALSPTISQFSSLHDPGTLVSEQSTCSHPVLESESVQ